MKKYLKDLSPAEVILRLKAGESVRYDGADAETKYIEGVLCNIYTDKLFSINSIISVDRHCIAYFETPDELKLKVGKCYRTRDGSKAFVCFFMDEIDRYKGVIVGKASSGSWFEWDEQGLLRNYMLSDEDLVAEWSDDDEG